MDLLQEYFDKLRKLAVRAADDERTSAAIACEDQALVQMRLQLIDDDDAGRVEPFLQAGLCSDRVQSERIAIFTVALELEHELRKVNLQVSCEPYDKNQPLFMAKPQLWELIRRPEKDCDLIDVSNLDWDTSSQLLEISANESVRISQHLRPDCVRFFREADISPLYIRLDPYRVGREVPLLLEAAIRPAAPNWWRELKVFPGRAEAARYELMEMISTILGITGTITHETIVVWKRYSVEIKMAISTAQLKNLVPRRTTFVQG